VNTLAKATIKVENLPKFKRLYEATHRVLLERLEVGYQKREQISLEAWEELLVAHDAIAVTDSHSQGSSQKEVA
jgi:hypothetical protein